ncbi:MAG TPA: Gfo/Idh/MocA family oxidoreductase [Vicinamibacteria bacterium]|nr:Gfo/Idh/MocA family oxidoreductase [Vicinamibacteria bacterium]
MSERPVRAGVIGTGALGRHHARVWAEAAGATLVGVHDTDGGRAREVASRHGCRVFADAASLLEEVEAVSIAVPTVSHHEVASLALGRGRDVLLEKPITATLEEADDLLALAARRGAVLQAGHIERFNPATPVLLEAGRGARFVEVHRLGSFSPRSLDVDVVLDLMIHDLDIVLALDGSEPVQIEAVGVPVLTPRVDIANARLRLASGLIANLTASRVSIEKVRKFRVFAPSTYVSADFAAREAQVYRLEKDEAGHPRVASERRGAPDEEPLRRQIEAFAAAVRRRSTPVVSGADGRRALALAHAILGRMAEA